MQMIANSHGKYQNDRNTQSAVKKLTGLLQLDQSSQFIGKSPYRQGHGLGRQGLVVVGGGSDGEGTEEEQDLLMAVPAETESAD